MLLFMCRKILSLNGRSLVKRDDEIRNVQDSAFEEDWEGAGAKKKPRLEGKRGFWLG
jgi:hypothetical protein